MNASHQSPWLRATYLWAVLACATLACAPAGASSNGHMTVGPLVVELIDLRPDDGIAPDVWFDGSGADAGVAAAAQESWLPELVLHARFGPWHGTGAQASTRHSSASLLVDGGSDQPAGTSLSLHGLAIDFLGPFGASATFAATAVVRTEGVPTTFTLSPGTALTLRMEVHAQLATTQGQDSASASAFMELQSAGGGLLSEAFDVNCVDVCSVTDTGTIVASLSNLSSTPLHGAWGVSASLTGTAFASNVPEPASGALLLAGVSAVASITRRRARMSPRC